MAVKKKHQGKAVCLSIEADVWLAWRMSCLRQGITASAGIERIIKEHLQYDEAETPETITQSETGPAHAHN